VVTVYHSNRPIGEINYGYVYIYEEGRYVTSFQGYDASGESDELKTAIACFEKTSEVLEKLGYVGTPIAIVSKFANYGYAILSDGEWPEGDDEDAE
jgi:hypothetical protein